LKDAALLTLRINKLALEYGMILKDASMYNVQFIGCKPQFIDLASFEIYEQDTPWKSYYQFCKHFYSPLFLASKKNVLLSKMLLYFIDGIPLKEAVSLCNWKDFLNTGSLFHLYFHSLLEGGNHRVSIDKKIHQKRLINLLKHLEFSINDLKPKHKLTSWINYNDNNNYNDNSRQFKVNIINKFLHQIEGSRALDIGSNDGFFSQLLADKGMYTLLVDNDEFVIDKAFANNRENTNIHPLHMNLVNPTPGIGWNSDERKSFWQRCKIDLIQALAIVHHLVITHDIPFDSIAEKFAKHTRYLIIEFISVYDSQVQILLKNKPHHASNYNQVNFENSFGQYFNLKMRQKINETERELFFYEKK
jgi:SAM-dependent methyltransferase